MTFIHVHLLPWHWFWRNNVNEASGIRITWRGPLVFVWREADEADLLPYSVPDKKSLQVWAQRLRFHP